MSRARKMIQEARRFFDKPGRYAPDRSDYERWINSLIGDMVSLEQKIEELRSMAAEYNRASSIDPTNHHVAKHLEKAGRAMTAVASALDDAREEQHQHILMQKDYLSDER